TINTGLSNMNLSRREIFIPTTLAARKYFTTGRYLLFAGLEAGYQWGITNQWHTDNNGGFWFPASNWSWWDQSSHNKGSGPSLTPLAGIRMIGKNGIDHVLNIGMHFQKFYSESTLEDADFSAVDITYKRW